MGALPEGDLGWFGALVKERLLRSLGEREQRDWDAVYPGLDVDERAIRHTKLAARKAALYGAVSSAGAHVGEAATVLTEGLLAPLCVPAVVASLTGEVVATAKVQIDLAFDLASIYGAPIDVNDAAAVAAIFELALCSGDRGDDEAWQRRRAFADQAIFARLGRALMQDAALGLVPFLGLPVAASGSYRRTMRVGEVARRMLRRRAALSAALEAPVFEAAPALLLEGTWLLIVADGVATDDEIFIVASIAARSAPGRAPWTSRLEQADEAGWLAAARRLAPRDRARLMNALLGTAGLRGPLKHPERAFLTRAGAALEVMLDFDRVDAILRALDAGDALDPRMFEGKSSPRKRATALHTRPGTWLASHSSS
jgi:hypothetical protein